MGRMSQRSQRVNPSTDAVGRDDENENENDDENDDDLPARWKSPYNSRYTITKQTLQNHPVPESRASLARALFPLTSRRCP